MGMHGGVCSWASAKVSRGVPYALHPLPQGLNYVPGNLLLKIGATSEAANRPTGRLERFKKASSDVA